MNFLSIVKYLSCPHRLHARGKRRENTCQCLLSIPQDSCRVVSGLTVQHVLEASRLTGAPGKSDENVVPPFLKQTYLYAEMDIFPRAL